MLCSGRSSVNIVEQFAQPIRALCGIMKINDDFEGRRNVALRSRRTTPAQRPLPLPSPLPSPRPSLRHLTSGARIVLPVQISMRNARRGLLILLLPALLVACVKPPQEAIEAAQASIDAARRDPDVALYAPDRLREAEERLTELRAETAAQERKPAFVRKYDRTAALAAEARQTGDAARREAAAAKERAGFEAAALIESAAAALSAIEIKAGQARRLRGIKLDMNSVIASIVEARAMLEDARADHASLAYASSRAKAAAAGARLSVLDGVISQAMLLARKK
jgi:hypothetical protein